VSHSLSRVIDSFSGLRALVVGEAMLDSHLEGTTGRLCQEAPVPVVDVEARRDAPGGAANAAANVRSLGARVSFLSVVGDDHEAGLLRDALDGRGVGSEHLVVEPARQTLAKHRVVAASQLLVRYDRGSTGPIGPRAEREIVDRLEALWPACDAVIVSDYNYGVLTPAVIGAIAGLQAVMPRILVADSKRLAAYRRAGLTAVKPNYGEALRLLGDVAPGGTGPRADQMVAHGERILELTGARIAAVTLDTEGALVFERDRPPYRTFARPERHSRASGAGDTFVAALALALAAGAETPAAADLASAAAAVVVGRDGTACCSGRDLGAFVATGEKTVSGPDGLAHHLEALRRQARRVVLTNGCFDILHRGHVTYLSSAKTLGDVLIVGVNSDEGIRRLKGPERPINALEDRMKVLAALSCVDIVVPFGEDTPHELIRAVRPDVFVKGGDYTRETLPEAPLVEELGGEVRILSFVDDRSTTNIIRRIRDVGAATDGVAPVGVGLRAVASGADGHALSGRGGLG
jgi:D-beta-D-heptose 7-phosphate kinase/D-beta-D-heptose 1-phosphate adenosyltransferase